MSSLSSYDDAMMSTIDQSRLEAVVWKLRALVPGLRAVYLFGSQASGEASAASDVDLAVLAEQPLTARQRWEIGEAIADILRRDVDLVDLRQASTVLRIQVVGHGRRIWGEGPDLEVFEDFVFSDYARLNEERAGILADIREHGSVHGR